MIDFARAIQRPFTDTKKLLIGLLLSLPIPILSIIMNPMATGYALMSAKTASEGEYGLPQWERVWWLWLKAFLAGVISLIYLIPLVLLAILSVFLNLNIFSPQVLQLIAENPLQLYATGGWFFILIAIVTLAIWYWLPIAGINYMRENKFGAGFDFKKIAKIVFTTKYLLIWFIITLISIGIWFLSTSMGAITRNGEDIIWGTFILWAVVSTCIGWIFNIIAMTLYGNVIQEVEGKTGNKKMLKPNIKKKTPIKKRRTSKR